MTFKEQLAAQVLSGLKFFEVKKYNKKKYVPLSKRELIRKNPSKYKVNQRTDFGKVG